MKMDLCFLEAGYYRVDYFTYNTVHNASSRLFLERDTNLPMALLVVEKPKPTTKKRTVIVMIMYGT